jgi:hypothetical protein
VTADGERFVMILDRTADVRTTQIEIVLNSLDKLRQAALEKTR